MVLFSFFTPNIWQRLCFPIETDLLYSNTVLFHWSNHIFTPKCANVAHKPNRMAQAPRVINTQGNVTGGHGCDPCGVRTEASNVNRKWKENCFCLRHNCHNEATGGSTENKNGKLYCVATATSDLMAVFFLPADCGYTTIFCRLRADKLWCPLCYCQCCFRNEICRTVSQKQYHTWDGAVMVSAIAA